MSDLEARIARIEQELVSIRLQQGNAPVALAGQNDSFDIVVSGTFAFFIGDVLKCVAGTYSYLTSADTGPQEIGVVTAVNPAAITITKFGNRIAAGTPGTLYWAPDIGGNAASAPSVAGWWRIIERQISPTSRLVMPDVYAYTPVIVSTCDSGTPTDHEFAYFSNA